jgi:chromosome segregation protein
VNELRVRIAAAQSQTQFLRHQLERMQDELSGIQADIEETESEQDDRRRSQQAEAFAKELLAFDTEIEQLDHQLTGARREIDQFNTEEEEKKSRLVALQSQLRSVQRKVTNLRQQANGVEVNLARVETRQEDLRAEVERETPTELWEQIYGFQAATTGGEGISRQQLEGKLLSLQRQLEAIGSVDQETVKEYEETKERFDFLTEQTTDLSKSIGQLEQVIDELDATIKLEFQKNFKRINEDFQKYFKVLFEGGKSKLQLMTDIEKEPEPEAADAAPTAGEGVDAAGTPQSELADLAEPARELIGKKKKRQKVVSGIEIIASPPGKKVSHIAALSGGEKSLVSIALLCAIIANNPSPFVVLDEVEAALDEENSEKLAAIIRDLSKKTQIIVITHNRVTMKAADILYGVTMGKDGQSHILSVELSEAEELVAQAA